jgi:hypothetical protein
MRDVARDGRERMQVEGMNHFTILAEDLEATRRFYRDILGLREGYRPPLGFRASGSTPASRRSCTSSAAARCPSRDRGRLRMA